MRAVWGGNGSDGERFASIVASRVVAKHEVLVSSPQELTDGLERDVPALHSSRLGRVGEYSAAEIEKIELDARIHDHVVMKGLLERSLIDSTVDYQTAIGNQVPGEIPIEALSDLSRVMAGRRDTEKSVYEAPPLSSRASTSASCAKRVRGMS